MKQVFTTKMDNTVKIITTITIGAIIPIPIVLFFKTGITDAFILLLFILPIFTLAYFLRPFEYWIEDEYITIRKSLLPKKINLDEIQSVQLVDYKELKVRLRLWGSGGFWGWFGIFLSSEYGKINLQCSEKNNIVLIHTKDDQYVVLSPKERGLFCQELDKAKKALK
jgi:hypothetical protein